jgi:DNA-binding protein H-NS
MTKTYEQVMKQIETLEHEAERLKRKEVEGVIDRIRKAIEVYGLSATDLGLTGTRAKSAGVARKSARKKAGKAKAPAVVKFRDDQGHVWGGRGPRPQWLRDALGAGKELKDFAV